jgi:uncharacterized membrane protein YkgB
MLLCAALTLATGLAMRWAGVGGGGWAIAVGGAALVFLFFLPAMGERARQPHDAPERRFPWGG